MSSLPPTRSSFPAGHISERSRPLSTYQFFPSSSSRNELINARNEVPAAQKVEHLRFCSRKQLTGEYCWGFSTLLCLSDAWIREKIQARSDLLNPRRLLSPADLKNSRERNAKAAENENHLDIYIRKQLMEEHCWGVSTRLCLSDPWTVKKMLTRTDLLNPRTLLLPANVINSPDIRFLGDKFPHRVKCLGVRVTVYDADMKTDHRFVLKRWGYSTSYVLMGRWKEEFVKKRQLKDGDEIGLYWDSTRVKFIFSVLRRANFITVD